VTEPKTDHATEAESYLQGLDDLDAADAYVAVIAALAHSNLAQLGSAREMVELQRQLLASMLPTASSPTFDQGWDEATGATLTRLHQKRSEAISAERKDAYDAAISIVEELQP
jgi:hypothetical protein